jgi:hypothetical protein
MLLVGGYLSITMSGSHRALWPQLFGILAVAAVWLSVSLVPGAPRRVEQP